MTGHLRAAARPITARTWFDLGTVAVALILYSIAWPTLFVTHEVPATLAPLLSALAVFPILFVRVNPALGWAVSAGSALLLSLALNPTEGNDLPFQVVHVIVLFVLLFAVALRASAPIVVVAWAATSMLFATTMPGSESGPLWGWPIGFGALALFGYLLRILVVSRRRLEQQEEVTELERARRAILEEKARIARDLHDVVAHHMSMVVVQAQTAPYRIADMDPAARTEFESIGATARTALNEIRGMLGVLRSDGQLPEHAPQPTAAEVPALCASALRAGMPVECTVIGDLTLVPDTTGLVVYRVVQESMANSARHAPGAPVHVTVAVDPGLVAVTVLNAPATSVPRPAAGGGHGIDGMRTRVAAVGGELRAGPTPTGGFEVSAKLPTH
ncbi:two-component sensor histidine kinase [Nocardia mangyaensis]|uniref:histidine kinase n=1 Tax=Nocardia mangyaensis TaxID=2213200 RepID=A0A1J0VVY4_9NOCA|nr:histidine kinase [Nocardia mangyaensis]APE36204.1 two-component sensor histidine kinase [Nocardia mangyaensis]